MVLLLAEAGAGERVLFCGAGEPRGRRKRRTPGEVMEERLNTRSSSRNCRFLFLAWALLEVRNSLKPCSSKGQGGAVNSAAEGRCRRGRRRRQRN